MPCAYSHGFWLGFIGTPPTDDGPTKKLLEMFDSVEQSAIREVGVQALTLSVVCVWSYYICVVRYRMTVHRCMPRSRRGSTSPRASSCSSQRVGRVTGLPSSSTSLRTLRRFLSNGRHTRNRSNCSRRSQKVRALGSSCCIRARVLIRCASNNTGSRSGGLGRLPGYLETAVWPPSSGVGAGLLPVALVVCTGQPQADCSRYVCLSESHHHSWSN